MDIDLPGGEKIAIDDEKTAKLIIAMRDALKADAREAHERLSKLETEAKATAKAKADAEAAAKAAQEQAEVNRLKQAGEYEKAMELQKAQAEAQIHGMRSQLIRKDLHAQIASRDDIVKTAVPDIVDALASKLKLTDDGSLAADDGTAVDKVLESYFNARPHLVVAKLPAGNTSPTRGVPAGTAKTMTSDQLRDLQVSNVQAYRETVDGIANGSITITQ
jgi:hypothetical protein